MISGSFQPQTKGGPRSSIFGKKATVSIVNALRNATFAGAAGGSPGTMPTNWSTVLTNGTGLTQTLATGSSGGNPWIEIRLNGTAAGVGTLNVYFETATGVPASRGQTWAISATMHLSAGTLSGLSTPKFVIDENTAGGSYLIFANGNTSINGTPKAFAFSKNMVTPTVGAVRPYFQVPFNAAAIDATIRIALPRLTLV